MEIWPFEPVISVRERNNWLTDVISCPEAEQRIALRSMPRRRLELQHVFTEADSFAAEQLIKITDDFLIPGWPHVQRIGAVSAGSSVAVAVDETDLGLVTGAAAILWEAPEAFEQVVVESVAIGTVTLVTVVGNYTAARLMPLWNGHAPAGVNRSRPHGRTRSASIEFVITDYIAVASGSYTQYRGIDVLDRVPEAGGVTFSEPASWQYSVVDNGLGNPDYQRDFDYPVQRFNMRWRAGAEDEKLELRQFLAARRGRQKAFWFSSRNKDFTCAVTIGTSDTAVAVQIPPGLPALDIPFDIEIVTNAGATYRRLVDGYSVGASLWYLDIDSSLGASLNPSAIKRISVLHCVRFDSDNITIDHDGGVGALVQIPLINCPIPV